MSMYRVWSYVAAIALFWANIAPDGYHALMHFPLWSGGPVGALESHDGHSLRGMTLHFLFNDVLMRDLPVVGCVAAIGFTVALFVASVAFPAGPVQDAAKMGALFSLGSAVIAIAAGRLFGVRKKA